MKEISRIYILLFFLCVLVKNQSAQAVLQIAYGVEENQLILMSLDSTITHFGDEDDKIYYRRCIQHYLEFQALHIQRDYSKSYERIRHTQKLLIPLYDRMLSKNMTAIRSEINRLGRLARGKEKTQTNSFLRLALRDLTEAEMKLTMARNTRPYLYLLKLREMLFALKILKHSGRFVVLIALLHDANFDIQIESTDFVSVDSEIQRVFTDKQIFFRRMHWDNFFKILNEEGVYTTVLHEPGSEDLSNSLPGIDPAYFRRINITSAN